MGDEPRFSEKWDFRRQENNFEDSSCDDSESNSTPDAIIHNPNLAHDLNQIDNGTENVTTEQPVKTRKRKSKKDESKPEKTKQARRRKPKKTVCEEEKNEKKEETEMAMDDVGMFMKTLLDDLTASRERLMDWMTTKLCGSDQNVASRAKRAVTAVAAQKSVKKRRTKKMVEEEKTESERQCKPDENENDPEMNEPKEKSPEIAQNGGALDCNAGQLDRFLGCKEKSPEIAENSGDLDCNAGPLNKFLISGQDGLGKNYFQLQQQEGIVAPTEMENQKNETLQNPKTVVLAIEAPNYSQRQRMTSEANTIKNRSRTGSETQKDHTFGMPFPPKPSSSPSSLQSFPVASSLNSLFPSSSQGITSLASNNNFQLRQQPVASHIPDLSEFQTGFTGGQGFVGNPLFHNNGYFSGFPTSNLIAGGYNFPTQVNPATSSQQRDNNNMFGGLRMAGGAIRFSGNRFPESEVGNSNNNGLSDYRTSSGR